MRGRLFGPPGAKSLLLFDPTLVRAIENTQTLIIDCTYGIDPNIEMVVPHLDGVRQLMLVLAVKNDCVSKNLIIVINIFIKQ